MNPDRPYPGEERLKEQQSAGDTSLHRGDYSEKKSSAGGSSSDARTGNQKLQHFKVTRFMFEAATKLSMTSQPLATACMIYHRVAGSCDLKRYDAYLMGATALYLAGKIDEEHLKLRDVINVCHNTLHPDKPLLDIGPSYWSLRESVAQYELWIMRMLRFRVDFSHPHKFLLHYIKSVQDWLSPNIVAKVPIANTAWAILRDCYHGDICLRNTPEMMAVSILYMTLQLLGVEVPYNLTARNTWWQVMVEGVKLEDMRQIITEITDIYSLEIGVMVA